MKKVFLCGILMAIGATLFAQENNESDTTNLKNWSFSGFFQQNTNQVSFTNWAAGGENSFSLVSQARFDANYKRDDIQWENYVDLSYGIIKTENTSLRKNTDKIDVFSKVGKNLNDKISMSALINFQSQFAEGFNFPNDSVVVSRFMAPGYLTGSVGFDYKPFEFLSIYVSPATGKFTFVTDQILADQGRFGVEPAEFNDAGENISDGKNVNPEFGSLVRIAFNKEIFTNVIVNTRVTLFNNYTDSDISNRKNTDVDWLLDVNMPVNEFITVSLGFHLIYDHDIKIPKMGTNDQGEEIVLYNRPTTQFKQQIGVGLVYKF
ncbi:MAG: DUF3078 domain-containing protein [Bacteroidota bacterium]